MNNYLQFIFGICFLLITCAILIMLILDNEDEN